MFGVFLSVIYQKRSIYGELISGIRNVGGTFFQVR